MPDTAVRRQSDSPAVALGPTALVLGVLSAIGAWVPALMFFAFPWAIIGGALAVTLGAVGIHHARQGIGRLWMAVAGTALGVIGFAGPVYLIWAMSG